MTPPDRGRESDIVLQPLNRQLIVDEQFAYTRELPSSSKARRITASVGAFENRRIETKSGSHGLARYEILIKDTSYTREVYRSGGKAAFQSEARLRNESGTPHL